MRSSLLRAALTLILAGTALSGASRLTAVHADSGHPVMNDSCSADPSVPCISVQEAPVSPAGTITISGYVQDVPGPVTLYVSESSSLFGLFATGVGQSIPMVGAEYAGYSSFHFTTGTFHYRPNTYLTAWVEKGPANGVPKSDDGSKAARALVRSNTVRFWAGTPRASFVRPFCYRLPGGLFDAVDRAVGWAVLGTNAIGGDLLQVNLIAVLPLGGQLTVSRQEVTAGFDGRFRVMFDDFMFVDHDHLIAYDWHTVAFQIQVTDRFTGERFSSEPRLYSDVCP